MSADRILIAGKEIQHSAPDAESIKIVYVYIFDIAVCNAENIETVCNSKISL